VRKFCACGSLGAVDAAALTLWLSIAYLAGSVPFGLLLARAAGCGDVRRVGSGNIGATNVARAGGLWLGAATVVLDGGKGAAAALLAGGGALGLAVGAAAVVGHVFPVWLKFKGGKGFATTLGVLLAAAPWAGVAACGAWLAAFALTRISAAGALAALAAGPAVAFAVYGPASGGVALAICALVAGRHAGNIRRLLAGAEPRMGGRE
jgi:acyl phosphate:glycerol-3-phosphate acyltransferase